MDCNVTFHKVIRLAQRRALHHLDGELRRSQSKHSFLFQWGKFSLINQHTHFLFKCTLLPFVVFDLSFFFQSSFA